MRTDVATEDLAASAPESGKKSGGREIILRVVMAAILAPLGAWACWTGGLALTMATGACAVLASAEWTRMASQTEVQWARVLLLVVMAAGGLVYGGTILALFGSQWRALLRSLRRAS